MRLASDVLVNAWRPIFFREAAHAEFLADTVPAVIRLASVGMIGIGLSVALFSRELLMVLAAPSYGDAAVLVPFLAGAMAVKGLYSFPYLAVWYRKKTIWVPMLTATTMAFSVASNLVLTPIWGAYGAASVQFMSYLVLFALMWWLGQTLLPIRYPWREVGIAAAAAVVAVLAGLRLPLSASGMAAKVALLAAYVAIVAGTGGVRASERRMLLHWPKAESSSETVAQLP
jgi:O-antigen/teichoic acid export membrane protein